MEGDRLLKTRRTRPDLTPVKGEDQTARALRKTARPATILILAITLLLAAHTGQITLPASAHASIQAPPANSNPKIAVNPHNQSSLALTPGSLVSYQVNLTSAPSIVGFGITLSYDYSILHVASFDPSSVLDAWGSDVPYTQECVPDIGISIGTCTLGQGYIDLAFYLSSGAQTSPTTNSTSGQLFKVTFTVEGQGSTEIHIRSSQIFCCLTTAYTNTPMFPTNFDGFFTNNNCSPGALCTPPIPNFRVSPVVNRTGTFPEAAAGQELTFNASSSKATNKGGTITSYTWDYGVGLSPVTTNSSSVTYAYTTDLAGRDRIITLTVKDSYGITASKSFLIRIILVWLELDIKSLFADPSSGITAGTVVSLTVLVSNLSTRSENATVGLQVGGLPILSHPATFNMSAGSQKQLSATWDTTGKKPSVYRVDASVDPVRNSTGSIIQNDTSNIRVSTFVQLIEPLPSGFGIFFGLSSLQSLGVWAVLAGGAGAAISFLRRKKPSIDTLP